MSFRVFVVVAVLLIGILLNGTLIFLESVPEPVLTVSQYKVEDPHKEMRWTPGNRRSNMQAFGLPPKMIDEITERLDGMTTRDRKGDFAQTLKDTPDVGGALCSNTSKLPSRYQATGMLIAGDRGTRRSVVDFNRLRVKLAYQQGYRPVDLEGMYRSTELIPNAPPDAFALNVAALMLGQEVERLEKEDQWGDGIFGPPDITSFLTRNAEIEQDMIEFFAAMHYIHEVARNPANEFCGVRAGVSFTPGGE